MVKDMDTAVDVGLDVEDVAEVAMEIEGIEEGREEVEIALLMLKSDRSAGGRGKGRSRKV